MAVLLALRLLTTPVYGDDGLTPPAPPPEAVVVVETETPEEVVPTVPPLPAPRAYLYQTYPDKAPVLDCIIRLESTWVWAAKSGPYVGLAQFDFGTWLETPQGRAGLSRTDPYASIDALAWGVEHLGYGRWPNTSRRCR